MNLSGNPFYFKKEAIEWVNIKINEMTDEEKIGQLFCPIGLEAPDEVLKGFVSKYKPGGMMYRPSSKEKIKHMHQLIKEISNVPMLFGANLEAGGNGLITEGTCFGKQMQIAATNEPIQAYRLGKVAASEANSVGGNWSFGPVLDININFRNPITNVRTFGSDIDTILTMSKEYMKGAREEGVACAIKHFPGDGVDERDQHLLISENSLSVEEWDASFGKIYSGMINEGVLSVMVGHIRMPAYEKYFNKEIKYQDCMPATLSEGLLQGLLREKLDFNGVIVTDATAMMGFNTAMSRRKAIPETIRCGCDMILFNKNIEEDYEYIREALDNGTLSWERVNEAVTRKLAMKASMNLYKEKECNSESVIGCKIHKEWASECADKSVTLVKDTQKLLPISVDKYPRIRLHIVGDDDNGGFKEGLNVKQSMVELFEKEGFEVSVYDNENLNFHEIFEEGVEDVSKKFDLAVYVANIETASNQTTTRLQWIPLMAANAPWYMYDIPVLFISTANPYHLFDAPYLKTYINAYSAHEEVLNSIVEKIMGRSEFTGTNPIDPFCGMNDSRF